MNKTFYDRTLHLLQSTFNKKTKYDGITIHTHTDEQLQSVLSMLSEEYSIDLTNTKFRYDKCKNSNFHNLYYFDTLAYNIADTSTYPYLKICYDDEEVRNKILAYCNNPKITNRSFWYPNRPEEISTIRGAYYKGELTDETKNKYPIYIISKGRATIKGTAKYLEEMQMDYNLVIEPKEFDEYKLHHPEHKLLICPENFSERGQGSIPVRNFVWEHSIQCGASRHWILDDNIINYKRLNSGKKTVIKSPLIFRVVENYVDRFSNINVLIQL